MSPARSATPRVRSTIGYSGQTRQCGIEERAQLAAAGDEGQLRALDHHDRHEGTVAGFQVRVARHVEVTYQGHDVTARGALLQDPLQASTCFGTGFAGGTSIE